MQARRVKCPNCGGLLSLPGDVRDCFVRCGLCRRNFQLPQEIPVPEDTIFGWIHQDRDEEDELADTLAPMPDGRRLQWDSSAGTVLVDHDADGKRQLRVVSLERRGALFEFPSEYLCRDEFRCAFPRVCVHCLGRAHLSAHLIIFAPQLRDSFSLEAEYKANGLIVGQEQLGDLSCTKLLKRLPKLPDIPAPGDLPMPYWVCDLCNATGEISGQIRVDQDSGAGICRLYMRNLQVSASFFANVAGTKNRDYAKFVEFFRHIREDRWDGLPSVVRHRLEQWFKPADKERFLVYIPDRNRARTEDGMAGVVISTRRVVYCRPPIHQEFSVNSLLTLQMRTFGAKKITTITASDSKPRPITLDRKGEMALRRGLSEGEFRTIWR